MNPFWTTSGLVLVGILAGCGQSRPPVPPEVNATTEGGYNNEFVRIEDHRLPPGAVVLLVYTDSVSKLAQTHEGYWIIQWYLCRFKIIRPVRKDVEEDAIVFVHKTIWEGMTLRIGPQHRCHYYKGQVLLFVLRNNTKPYQVLYQEPRSLLPPYGPIIDRRCPSANQPIWEAVRRYFGNDFYRRGGGRPVEETGQYCIFAVGLDKAPELVKVDRKTLKVEPVPVPKFRTGGTGGDKAGK